MSGANGTVADGGSSAGSEDAGLLDHLGPYLRLVQVAVATVVLLALGVLLDVALGASVIGGLLAATAVLLVLSTLAALVAFGLYRAVTALLG